MFELSRKSAAYKNLKAEGLFVETLEPLDYRSATWRIVFYKSQHMDRDVAREKIKTFLTNEFEAQDFDWYVARKNPDHLIVCIFNTYAL